MIEDISRPRWCSPIETPMIKSENVWDKSMNENETHL